MKYVKQCLEEQTEIKWTIDGIFLLSRPLNNRSSRKKLKGKQIKF